MFGIFGNKPKVFISEEQHLNNLQSQLAMTPQTLEQLADHGVDENKELKLEYFFYTNTEEKAKNLGRALVETGYSCEYGQSAGDDSIFVITGWTNPIEMEYDKVIEWTGAMCVADHRHDCEFDGWGTNPDQ